MKWGVATHIACHRPERVERPERMERERGIVGGRPNREQSSRPPPPSQSKAKDPMKLIGLKSNIKLSLVSKVGIFSATRAGPDSFNIRFCLVSRVDILPPELVLIVLKSHYVVLGSRPSPLPGLVLTLITVPCTWATYFEHKLTPLLVDFVAIPWVHWWQACMSVEK